MINDFSGSKSPFDIPKFRDQGDSPIEPGRLLAPLLIGVKPAINPWRYARYPSNLFISACCLSGSARLVVSKR